MQWKIKVFTMEFIFMFSLILTWIVVFLMTRKGTNSTSKRKIDALRKWNIEYYYGKTVEAAREGNLKGLKRVLNLRNSD